MSKETLSVIQGFHTKGVCAVDFSCNGKLLVTVGIDAAHSIAVWKWAEGGLHICHEIEQFSTERRK